MEVLSLMQEVYVWATAHLQTAWNHHEEGHYGTRVTREDVIVIRMILMWRTLSLGGWFVDL